MKLPEPFLEKMRQLLGEEYPFYEKSYEKERVHGPVSYTHLREKNIKQMNMYF